MRKVHRSSAGAFGWLLILLISITATDPYPAAGGDGTASPQEWSMRMARAEMARRGDSLGWRQMGGAKWDYTTALFCLSLLKLHTATGDAACLDFARRSMDSFLDDAGQIHGYRAQDFSLDSIHGGKVLLEVCQLGGLHGASESNAVRTLLEQLDQQPRTPEGGFWHKKRYSQQMWLDGTYMAWPFLESAGRYLGRTPAALDAEVLRQEQLIQDHLRDSKTGLFFHGWDSARAQAWANPETGCSSNFWSRGMGWYAMALVDVLEVIPASSTAHARLQRDFQQLAAAFLRHRDPQSGLWWQVMDQPGREGNYLESSASAMFLYALAKGKNSGALPDLDSATLLTTHQAYVRQFISLEGTNGWSIRNCCAVAGLGKGSDTAPFRDGSYRYYISEPMVTNDLKSVGPFILAGIEIEKATGENRH